MATLSVNINSALGNTTTTKTFNATDANRIMTAFQSQVPGGTQQQLTDQLTQMLVDAVSTIVVRKETVIPAAPTLT